MSSAVESHSQRMRAVRFGWSYSTIVAPSGRIRWLRADDLRFDLGETRQFLEAQADVELDPFDIEPFFEATQGWPAVLQLAANDIARVKRKEDAIAAFTGLFSKLNVI